MTKVEPMTVEEIKKFLASYDIINGGITYHNWGRLILAWAESEARARQYEARWHTVCKTPDHVFPASRDHDCPRWKPFERWRDEVLSEIGWPEAGKE